MQISVYFSHRCNKKKDRFHNRFYNHSYSLWIAIYFLSKFSDALVDDGKCLNDLIVTISEIFQKERYGISLKLLL